MLVIANALEKRKLNDASLLPPVYFCSHKEEDISVIKNNILATNQNKAPSHSIGSYEVLELLGSGAFGSVYKVDIKFIPLPHSAATK